MTNEQIFSQIEGTQFQIDLGNEFSMNGKPMSRAYYNLVISIRDVKIFQIGMKPHRNWRLKDVKWYFGIKGNKGKVLTQLEAYKQLWVADSE
tara:strand:+ start:926 stop:1201 length:276 start_codon:yes stop_codon:yes gene_type:complete